MIAGDRNFAKLTSETPERPVSSLSPVLSKIHRAGVERVTSAPLSGNRVAGPLFDLLETPVSQANPMLPSDPHSKALLCGTFKTISPTLRFPALAVGLSNRQGRAETVAASPV